MISGEAFLWAFLGGVVPAILWLLFWLREDRNSPEPRGLILITFVFGMISVFAALLGEKGISLLISSGTTLSIILWASIEEIVKFGAAYFAALRKRENDEPVDAMIYLITAALGFAALENTFFLIGPIIQGDVVQSLITGNLRFVGSSLLHVVASGTIGIFYAYAFCETGRRKKLLVGIGLVLSIILHVFFNFFILEGESNLFVIFGFVWIGVVVLILFFERVKRIDRTCVTSSN